ncbi:MAG: radical SAM protein [Candidatus ainarchaeum sp.]|nr:radical SAM protein [Candidatus ainarchaeum sp.]
MKKGITGIFKASKIAKQVLISKITGKRIPIAVNFHLNTDCNLRCKYCYANVDSRFDSHPVDLNTEQVLGLIDEMYKAGTRWLILLGGEPLLRQDIGEIVAHIKKKGIICEIVTNGTLVKNRIDAIKDVDLLCVSCDGDEIANDIMRGNGTYKKIVEGIGAASANGINIRIHAVLSRHNINKKALDSLVELAEKNRATLGYSVAITHEYNNMPELNVPDNETREFWKMLKEYKKKGKPVYNTIAVLDYLLGWPISYQKVIKKMEDWPDKKFRPRPCFAGKRMCYIDCQGFVYPCIVLGVKKGLNVKEVGFKKAWDALESFSCGACGFPQYIETNNVLDLKAHSILLGLKTFLK